MGADTASAFSAEYTRALQAYIDGAVETALARGYELGRQAMAGNIGVLEMVGIHHEAMAEVLKSRQSIEEGRDVVSRSVDFFSQALSPYEVTHRGFQEATEVMQRVLRFASVVCHELRTPLTSILASGGILQEMVGQEPDTLESKLVSNVLAGARSLKHRNDDLADIVGFETGILSLMLEPLDTREFIQSAMERLGPEVEQAGLRLTMDLCDDMPVLSADAGRIDQVITNLVQNAIKYSPFGKTIDVIADVEDAAFRIEVRDHGPGITDSDQSKLFLPYFRGDGGRHDVPGMGIGLSLCREIVHAHGGRIWAESVAGRGASFKIALPLSRARGF